MGGSETIFKHRQLTKRKPRLHRINFYLKALSFYENYERKMKKFS